VGLLHNAFRPLGLCVWLSVLKVGEIYLIPCNVSLCSFSFFHAFFHQTYVNQSVNLLTSGKLTNDKEERKHVKKGIGTWWLVPVQKPRIGEFFLSLSFH
jgi:hypothetical protein